MLKSAFDKPFLFEDVIVEAESQKHNKGRPIGGKREVVSSLQGKTTAAGGGQPGESFMYSSDDMLAASAVDTRQQKNRTVLSGQKYRNAAKTIDYQEQENNTIGYSMDR